MSQASRLHALRHETERRQVARELVQFIALPADGRHADFDMDDPGTVEILLRDHVFDVHAARAHATGLVLYGRHHTRVSRRLELDSRGRARWATPVGDWAEGKPGAPWPHLEAHDLAFVRLGQRILDMLEGQPGECQGLTCRQGFTVTDGHSGRPSIGQETRGMRARFQLGGRGWVWRGPCPDCHGTGHNLRGKLPGVEWTPAARRKARDTTEAFIASSTSNVLHAFPAWLEAAYEAGHESGWTLVTVVENRVHGVGFKRLAHVERQVATGTFEPGHMSLTLRRTPTRVCPRGEHRQLSLEGQELDAHGSAAWYGHRPASRYAASPEDQTDRVAAWDHATSRLPAWRRGEIEHARQRREREARRESSRQLSRGDDRVDAMRWATEAAVRDWRGAMPGSG